MSMSKLTVYIVANVGRQASLVRRHASDEPPRHRHSFFGSLAPTITWITDEANLSVQSVLIVQRQHRWSLFRFSVMTVIMTLLCVLYERVWYNQS